MTADEFDSVDAKPGWRYELIRGVVIVTPAPLETERVPNAELEYRLRQCRYQHPNGRHLDKTLPSMMSTWEAIGGALIGIPLPKFFCPNAAVGQKNLGQKNQEAVCRRGRARTPQADWTRLP